MHPDRVSDRDLAVDAMLVDFEVGVDQLGHVQRRIGSYHDRDVKRADRPAGIAPRGSPCPAVGHDRDEQARPGRKSLS